MPIGPGRYSSPSQIRAADVPAPTSVLPSPLNRKYISLLLRHLLDFIAEEREIGVNKSLARSHHCEFLLERRNGEEGNRFRMALLGIIEVDDSLLRRLIVKIVEDHWAM